jgi:hypothetical protein
MAVPGPADRSATPDSSESGVSVSSSCYHPDHRPEVKIGDVLNWSRLGAIRTIVLVMLGFVALVYGAFILLPAAGYLVLGVALLLLAYLTDPGEAKR